MPRSPEGHAAFGDHPDNGKYFGHVNVGHQEPAAAQEQGFGDILRFGAGFAFRQYHFPTKKEDAF